MFLQQLYDYLCPFPRINDQRALLDGIAVPAPDKCRSCTNRVCIPKLSQAVERTPEQLVEIQCPYGFTCYGFKRAGVKGQIVGVYGSYDSVPQGVRRRDLRERHVRPFDVTIWLTRAERAHAKLMAFVGQEVDAESAGLHDLKTAVGLLQTEVQEVVRSLPGETIEEKIEAFGNEGVVSLMLSASLLATRLRFADLAYNPEAATYGNARSKAIYKLVHRIVRFFRPQANRRNVPIVINGNSYNRCLVYDSFDTLPLVLLDNALKYSVEGSRIVVVINDIGQHQVSIAIRSRGQVVPATERESIFERRVRGSNANQQGSGLGLFVATVVAQAHGSTVRYRATATEGIGDNEFSVVIGAPSAATEPPRRGARQRRRSRQ